MNFFEQELRKVVSPKYPDAIYVGRACFVPLGEGMVTKLQFVTCGLNNHYEALKMSTFNARGGEVDTLLLHLSDFFDRDQTGDVEVPNIRMCNYEFQWQVQPTEMNYAAMRDAVTSYLSVFQPHGQIMEQTTEHSGAPNHPQKMTM